MSTVLTPIQSRISVTFSLLQLHFIRAMLYNGAGKGHSQEPKQCKEWAFPLSAMSDINMDYWDFTISRTSSSGLFLSSPSHSEPSALTLVLGSSRRGIARRKRLKRGWGRERGIWRKEKGRVYKTDNILSELFTVSHPANFIILLTRGTKFSPDLTSWSYFEFTSVQKGTYLGPLKALLPYFWLIMCSEKWMFALPKHYPLSKGIQLSTENRRDATESGKGAHGISVWLNTSKHIHYTPIQAAFLAGQDIHFLLAPD